MKRGEIWWVNLNPTQGSELRKTRPAIILTVDAFNRARRTVVIVPLSRSALARSPIVIATPSAGTDWVAVCDQLRTVDKSRLIERQGQLSSTDLAVVSAGVQTILGLV